MRHTGLFSEYDGCTGNVDKNGVRMLFLSSPSAGVPRCMVYVVILFPLSLPGPIPVAFRYPCNILIERTNVLVIYVGKREADRFSIASSLV